MTTVLVLPFFGPIGRSVREIANRKGYRLAWVVGSLKWEFPLVNRQPGDCPSEVGVEAKQLNELLKLRNNFKVNESPDEWDCTLNISRIFNVSSLRKRIEAFILPSTNEATRWNIDLPIKINVHSWRLLANRIPTCFNLDSRGVPIGQKIGFKPKKEYRPILKKSTASSSGNKKKGVESTIEVSKSNPFDVLNSFDNDGKFDTNSSNTPIGEKIFKMERKICKGMNGGIANSADKGTNNVNSNNTPIGEKIDKIERQICEGKIRISTSDKEGSDKCYGTNSLLEQWRDSYPDNDDYVPFDDDMYENHDLSDHLQSICDDLNIMVRVRKKK
nr:reverse transcriptase domain, reverse transcriptase zinc-binding domain protein [Tanacetum cinerariifolium]